MGAQAWRRGGWEPAAAGQGRALVRRARTRAGTPGTPAPAPSASQRTAGRAGCGRPPGPARAAACHTGTASSMSEGERNRGGEINLTRCRRSTSPGVAQQSHSTAQRSRHGARSAHQVVAHRGLPRGAAHPGAGQHEIAARRKPAGRDAAAAVAAAASDERGCSAGQAASAGGRQRTHRGSSAQLQRRRSPGASAARHQREAGPEAARAQHAAPAHAVHQPERGERQEGLHAASRQGTQREGGMDGALRPCRVLCRARGAGAGGAATRGRPHKKKRKHRA